MGMKPVKVSAKYRIAIPRSAREKLKIKVGDRLLVDVQDGIIILIPEPKRYADHLQGLHNEIWKGVDVKKYLDGNAKRGQVQQ
jgi:AbrB family looped-hinge helix DNA binding protein